MDNWIIVKSEYPHNGVVWVKILAHIKNNSNGEIRIYETMAIFDEETKAPSDFIWSAGNFSCDCNRGIFYNAVGGESGESSEECGEGLYSVNLQNPKTGEYFYKEYETINTLP